MQKINPPFFIQILLSKKDKTFCQCLALLRFFKTKTDYSYFFPRAIALVILNIHCTVHIYFTPPLKLFFYPLNKTKKELSGQSHMFNFDIPAWSHNDFHLIYPCLMSAPVTSLYFAPAFLLTIELVVKELDQDNALEETDVLKLVLLL